MITGKSIRRIFLDLDDVLNTFTRSVLTYVGVPEDVEHPGDWHMATAANKMLGYERFKSNSEFWRFIDRNVWATIPRSDDFDWLLSASKQMVGSPNVWVLTSPVNNADCLAGKHDWMKGNLPTWLYGKRQYVISSHKELLARPDVLLIDDADDNVNKFVEHGGQAILVPQPWNSLAGVDRHEHLVNQLRWEHLRSVGLIPRNCNAQA